MNYILTVKRSSSYSWLQLSLCIKWYYFPFYSRQGEHNASSNGRKSVGLETLCSLCYPAAKINVVDEKHATHVFDVLMTAQYTKHVKERARQNKKKNKRSIVDSFGGGYRVTFCVCNMLSISTGVIYWIFLGQESTHITSIFICSFNRNSIPKESCIICSIHTH